MIGAALYLLLIVFLSVALIAFGWHPCCCAFRSVAPVAYCQNLDFSTAIGTISNQYGNLADVPSTFDSPFTTGGIEQYFGLTIPEGTVSNARFVLCCTGPNYTYNLTSCIMGFSMWRAACINPDPGGANGYDPTVVYFSASPFVLVADVNVPAATFAGMGACPEVASGFRVTLIIP